MQVYHIHQLMWKAPTVSPNGRNCYCWLPRAGRHPENSSPNSLRQNALATVPSARIGWIPLKSRVLHATRPSAYRRDEHLLHQLAAQIEKTEPWNKKRPPVYG